MTELSSSVKTPCIKVCFLDAASGLCLGCFRTADEIGDWAAMASERRESILSELPGRAIAQGVGRSEIVNRARSPNTKGPALG